MTAPQAPTPGPLDSESVKLLVKGDLLSDGFYDPWQFSHIENGTVYGLDGYTAMIEPLLVFNSFIGRPDESGWMPWSGGWWTLGDMSVRVRHRSGSEQGVQSNAWSVRKLWKWSETDQQPGDIIAFRLAPTAMDGDSPCSNSSCSSLSSSDGAGKSGAGSSPTAPVEASGSEREVPWLTDDECDEVGKLRFALAMKVYRMSSDLRQNLRPQPSGETRADESLDDVARRLFAAQYPDRDYDDLKDMVQIGWLRKAHDEILSARANPSPTPAADADRGMKAFNFINDLYRIKAEFPAIRLHGALKKAEALAALKSTAAKEGGE